MNSKYDEYYRDTYKQIRTDALRGAGIILLVALFLTIGISWVIHVNNRDEQRIKDCYFDPECRGAVFNR